jgi:hypothetical protein
LSAVVQGGRVSRTWRRQPVGEAVVTEESGQLDDAETGDFAVEPKRLGPLQAELRNLSDDRTVETSEVLIARERSELRPIQSD